MGDALKTGYVLYGQRMQVWGLPCGREPEQCARKLILVNTVDHPLVDLAERSACDPLGERNPSPANEKQPIAGLRAGLVEREFGADDEREKRRRAGAIGMLVGPKGGQRRDRGDPSE